VEDKVENFMLEGKFDVIFVACVLRCTLRNMAMHERQGRKQHGAYHST
jgi:hypothetical protein